MGPRIKVWPQAIDHPARSIDCQQDPENPRDVARSVNQAAQQNKVNPKKHQTHGPIVANRIEQQQNLGMQMIGSKGRQVVRGCKCGRQSFGKTSVSPHIGE